jgi:transcription antitermination factor NusA-like protein
MQTPICDKCLESKDLCVICQEKLKNKEITKKEVSVLRHIYKLSNKTKSLKGIKIVKVIDCNILLIITGRGDVARLVGKGGSIVKLLAKKFKKQIRILEEGTNFKEFIEELITPAHIKGINTLYRNNEEIFKVRVPEFQKNHLILSPENFSQVISDFYNRKAEIVFEV